MPSKKGSSPLLKNYDKIVLVVAILVLVASGAVFITTKSAAEKRREAFQDRLGAFRVAHPETADIQSDIAAASNLYKRISNPDLIAWSAKAGEAGFFVPETRVWCAKSDCHAPIAPTDKVCPVCGTAQPGEPKPDVNADTDGDGIPDLWERKYGLNPHDVADASLDPDGDGFDNLAEYQAKTDPTDAKSHPDRLTMLRLVKIEATPLPIRFQSRGMLMPDKHYKSQFNYVTEETLRDPPTLYVKEGEPLVFSTSKGKVDTGYVFVGMEIKKVERTVTWTTTPQTTEVAYASVRRGKKTLVLEEGKAASDSNYKITVEQTVDGAVFTIDGDDGTIAVDRVKFHVKNVDVEKDTVTIASEDEKVEVAISRDNAIVTRPQEAEKPSAAQSEPSKQDAHFKK